MDTMPKPLDPMWEYGHPIDPNNRQKLNCKLCGKDISGGISRLKYHLAKIVGHEVDVCPAVTPEVMRIANQSILDMAKKRDEKEEFRHELASRTQSRTMGGTSDLHSFSSSTRPPHYTMPSSASPHVASASHSRQPSVRTMLKQREKDEADRLVTKCFLWGDVPFNIAKNNPYYHAMFQAVGPDYRGPSYNDLRGRLLDEEKVDCTRRLDELKQSWAVTGCTIMSDGWTDGKGRSLINFLVNFPRGTVFIKSVDASAYVKDARLLCDLLDKFIQEVGPQYVVQVITDNAASYVAAGRMLMERYASLYWTPCAAHCIDLMLEDMGKLPWIKEVIDSAKNVTKYIYNHTYVLSLMRRFTGNKELLRPAITRFATSFISLQSMHKVMMELQRMFLSDEWASCVYSNKQDGQTIARMVQFYLTFWAQLEEVCAISEPLVKVLCLVDGEKPATGYLHEVDNPSLL